MRDVKTVESSLFRPEAVEFQIVQRRWGEIVELHPVSSQLMSWASASVVLLIIGFLCVAQYARKESVSGYLKPSQGVTKIYAPQPGVVREVHVAAGDKISKGAALLTVETAQITAGGRDVNLDSLTTLTAQRLSIVHQIKAEESRTGSEQNRLTALLKGQQAEISHLETQGRLQEERIKLTRSLLQSASQLSAKGYMADAEYKRRQQELLAQEQVLNELNERQASRLNQLTETRFALEQLPTVRSDKIQSLRNDLAWVDQRIAETEGRRAYVVRSPTSGVVSIVQATVGQTADPQQLQLAIIPDGSVLQAEVFVPTRAAGFIRTGQKVRLLYDAFPYQKYGAYNGHIVAVSQTILRSADFTGPLTLNEAAYKVAVALDRLQLEVDGKMVPLQPDMLLRADIILDKRPIIQWLLKPLYSTGNTIDLANVTEGLNAWVARPLASIMSAVWSAVSASDSEVRDLKKPPGTASTSGSGDMPAGGVSNTARRS